MAREDLPVKVRAWIEDLWNSETIARLPYGPGEIIPIEEFKTFLPGDPYKEISPLEWLHQRGLKDEFIEKYHFGYVREGYFANSISIPILDGLAHYRTARFRRLTGEPKYDHPKGERAHLFNISSVKHRTIYITEGEFDATILEQTGRPAVGVPGINNFREEWRWLFVGNDIRIIFDSEKPDSQAFKDVRQALGRIVRQLEPLAEKIEVIELPVGEDVSSLYVSNPNGLEEILRQYDD